MKTQLSKIQPGGFDILNLMNSVDTVNENANKAKDLFNRVLLDDVIKKADISRNFLPNPIKKFLE